MNSLSLCLADHHLAPCLSLCLPNRVSVIAARAHYSSPLSQLTALTGTFSFFYPHMIFFFFDTRSQDGSYGYSPAFKSASESPGLML